MLELRPELLSAYLAVAVVLFAAGVFAVATRRSAIGVLVGSELLLNAAALQFAAYGAFRADPKGQAAAVFVLVVAAAEAAVVLGVLFAVYRTRGDVDLERTRELSS